MTRNKWLASGTLILIYTVLFAVFSGRPGYPTATAFYLFLGFWGIAAVTVLGRWLPMPLYSLCLLFTFAAQGLGSLLSFYWRFAYFDLLVHLLSGFLVAAVAAYLLPRLIPAPTQRLLLVFVVLSAIAAAGCWELWECGLDLSLNMSTQGDLIDTMSDMLCGTLGGLCYAIRLYVKKAAMR